MLVNNSSLFILFGSDRDGQYTNDMAVLDVRDINNISFVNNFPFDNASNSSSANNNGTQSNGTQPSATEPKSSGLSTGAIAGIAVGGVAAVSLDLTHPGDNFSNTLLGCFDCTFLVEKKERKKDTQRKFNCKLRTTKGQ